MKQHSQQSNRIPSKVRAVPVALIRTPTAGVLQRELRPAWAAEIAAHMDLNKIGHPIVNHKFVGDKDKREEYELIDGQHRVAGLLMWDPSIKETSIDCEVYEGLSEQQAADMFLGRNTTKPVAPLDKHFVACTAGHTADLDIRRAVESNGQKITRNRNEGISAIGALRKVYDRSGDVVLGRVIRTINLSFDGDPLGYDRLVLEGLGLVYHRFPNGKVSETVLAKRLGNLKQGARELLRRAEDLRVRTGNQKTHCVAATIIEVYNKSEGHGKTRLPGWWKEVAAKEVA